MANELIIGNPINIASSKLSSKTLKHPHQINAVNALSDYFQLKRNKANRKGLLVMPTGSGKTYTSVFWLMKEAVAAGYTIIWVVHRKELVDQAFWEFVSQTALLKDSKKKYFNIIPVSGMDEHKRMEDAYDKDVYVLSRQSAANRNGMRNFDNLLGNKKKVIMVVDEAHHAIAGQYIDIWNKIKEKAPNAILLGLTATPTRLGDRDKEELLRLFNVDKNIKNNIGRNGFIYQITMAELLKCGFLAKAVPVTVKTEIEAVNEYHITDNDIAAIGDNDLSEEAFARIAKSARRNKRIVDEYVNNYKEYLKHKDDKQKSVKEVDDYGKTIVFAINIEHAKQLCNDFNRSLKKYNIRAEYVVSGKPDNQEIIKEFKENSDPAFKILINCQILTEGSDIPDVKTVFLTRQTSSDVLLMQMIGRALRGEDAGGTKIAYVVSFIDNWKEKFDFWMNPENLELFTEIKEAEELEEIEEELPEISSRKFPELVSEDENGDLEIVIPEQKNMTDWEQLYLKIYNEMSLEGSHYVPPEMIVPVGWYDLDFGSFGKKTLVVYDKQLDDYKNVERNIKNVLLKYDSFKVSGTWDKLRERFNLEYFHNMRPTVSDTSDLLRHIKYHRHMPNYFTFEECEGFDPIKLAKILKKRNLTVKEKEEWLKEIYLGNAVLKNIYEGFTNFKKTVFDAMHGKEIAVVSSEMLEKKPFKIIDNYYNLDECLAEVLQEYPKLNANGLVRIQWSNVIPKRWYALCQRSKDYSRFQITVSKICSSPYVDREVIKYLIFHELLHKNGYWKHDKDFRSREWQYPNSANIDAFLNSVIYSLYDFTEYEHMMPKRTVIKFPERNIEIKESSQIGKIYEENKNKTNFVDYTNQKETVVCEKCGSILPEKAKFCMECGTRLK